MCSLAHSSDLLLHWFIDWKNPQLFILKQGYIGAIKFSNEHFKTMNNTAQLVIVLEVKKILNSVIALNSLSENVDVKGFSVFLLQYITKPKLRSIPSI